MRFRPLGASGMAVSAVSLSLTDSTTRTTPQAWQQLIYAAFESGINAFEVVGRQPSLIEGVGQAIKAVERRLVFVALRLGPVVSPAGAILRDFSPDSLMLSLESFLGRTGLDYVDAVILDDPQVEELSPQALDGLKAMREAGRARMLGVAGQDSAIDAYISAGAFDLLCTPFNLVSGWKERLRLKAAMERDMAVIGYGYFPGQFQGKAGAAPQKKGGWWGGGDNPLGGVGTYAFLDRTANWTAEELCLAYALTEPTLATVQISADRVERLEALSEVPERDLPAGVAAQIEMARFTPGDPAQKKARRA
jgi:aryl-alcohol dehydrogenase-like predicted oxidoreductase